MHLLGSVGELVKANGIVELTVGHEGAVGQPLTLNINHLEERSLNRLSREEDAVWLIGVPSVLTEIIHLWPANRVYVK